MLARARQLLGSAVTLDRMVLPDLTVDGVFDAAVCTFDGLNYLTVGELRRTLKALVYGFGPRLGSSSTSHRRARGVHMRTPSSAVNRTGLFVISSTVDPAARTCDARIEVTHARVGDPFTEQHRQHFHSDADLRAALVDAGFEVAAVTDEYTHQPVDESTLLATWVARRRAL